MEKHTIYLNLSTKTDVSVDKPMVFSRRGGKTVAARGLVSGRGPLQRSGRDSVFPPLLLKAIP